MVGYSPGGGKESDMTEQLRFHFSKLNGTDVSYSMPRFLAANGRSERCLWHVAKGKTMTRFRVTHSTNGKAREHITENCITNTWAKAAESSAGVTAGLLLPWAHMLSCLRWVWLCATLWDYSPPGFCIHWILKAEVLTWVAMPSSRESSEPTDWICVSWVSCGFFTTSATYYS